MPPGFRVYVDDKNGRYQAVEASQGRRISFSRAWLLHGHRMAAIGILQQAWVKALATRGLTPADCPIKGVFVQAAVVAAAPAAAAAASA